MNSTIFKALGNDTRLLIVQNLMIKEHNVTDLTTLSGKDQTTVSRHLSTLTNAQLITQKRVGRNIYYKITNTQTKNWLECAIEHKGESKTNKPLRNKIENFLVKQEKNTDE
tara:strand:+ start:425 stop:757 length:333 start_codon:yes stop_codon:yes gene_type:complete